MESFLSHLGTFVLNLADFDLHIRRNNDQIWAGSYFRFFAFYIFIYCISLLVFFIFSDVFKTSIQVFYLTKANLTCYPSQKREMSKPKLKC